MRVDVSIPKEKSVKLRLTKSNREKSVNIAVFILLVILTLATIFPFLWMVSASLKSNNDVFQIPFRWIPEKILFSNYAVIWEMIPFGKFFYNTAKLSLTVTAVQLFTSSFAAYGFAKLDFPGRDKLFFLYVATIAVPWQAYMVPQFMLMNSLKLTNTHLSIIILQSFTAFGVFLMRQFFKSIPDELCEAARIDGLSEYGIYWKIILPLSKPVTATLTIFTFVAVWNDFLGPFIYLNDTNLKTIQLGLRMFFSQYTADYALVMAASVVSLIPIVILFIFTQKYFIEGIASTGVKG